MRAWDRIAQDLDFIEGVAGRKFWSLSNRAHLVDRLQMHNVDFADILQDVLIEVERYARRRRFKSRVHFRRWAVLKTRTAVIDVVRRLMGRPENQAVRIEPRSLDAGDHRDVMGEAVPAAPGATPAEALELADERRAFWRRVRHVLADGEYRVVYTWAHNVDPCRKSWGRYWPRYGVEMHRHAGVRKASFWPLMTFAKAKLRAALA